MSKKIPALATHTCPRASPPTCACVIRSLKYICYVYIAVLGQLSTDMHPVRRYKFVPQVDQNNETTDRADNA
eukprot:3066989-Pleurochrysis_carterae.AAC.1